MTIISPWYEPSPRDAESAEKAFQLYCDNLSLILEHHADILCCAEYFFCRLPFAWCSWSYVAGDGPLCLGYLLLGWKNDKLINACPDCGAKIIATSFGGSPFTGGHDWCGYCLPCQSSKKSQHWDKTADDISLFHSHFHFVLNVRRQFPYGIPEWVQDDELEPPWLVYSRSAPPVTLEVLIAELKAGKVRNRLPPRQVLSQDEGFKLKFSDKDGRTVILGD